MQPESRSSLHTPAGAAATRIVLGTFRLNGLLLTAGDELAAPDGLTAARWQVLGAVALADRPLTVPQIARRMGLARQSVHATVRTLAAQGLLEHISNVDHRRSQLVTTTDHGDSVFRLLQKRQASWVNQLAAGLPPGGLDAAADVIDVLCERLDQATTTGRLDQATATTRRTKGGRR